MKPLAERLGSLAAERGDLAALQFTIQALLTVGDLDAAEQASSRSRTRAPGTPPSRSSRSRCASTSRPSARTQSPRGRLRPPPPEAETRRRPPRRTTDPSTGPRTFPITHTCRPQREPRDPMILLTTLLIVPPALTAQDALSPWFREIAAAFGLKWTHDADRTDRYRFPEIMGGGVGHSTTTATAISTSTSSRAGSSSAVMTRRSSLATGSSATTPPEASSPSWT